MKLHKAISLIITFLLIVQITAVYNVSAVTDDVSFEKMISVANQEVGYLETTYSDNTFSSKYGEWYGIPKGAWCAMFVSWCANQAGISTEVLPKFASCHVGMEWFKEKDLWRVNGYVPSMGDLIFFNDCSHVGIVEKVIDDIIYTIEGNACDENGENYGVRKREYSVSSPKITGFGLPDKETGSVINGKALRKETAYMLPSSDSQTVWEVWENDDLEILCKDGSFYLVMYPFLSTGKFVCAYVPENAVSTNLDIPSSDNYYTTNRNAVIKSDTEVYHNASDSSLMNNAGVDRRIRATLYTGQNVRLLFKREDYYFIKSDTGITGFIKSEAVDMMETDSSHSTETEGSDEAEPYEKSNNETTEPVESVAQGTNPKVKPTLEFTVKSLKLGVKEKIKISKILKAENINGKITIKNSNKKIASLSSKGVLAGKKAGTIKLKASLNGIPMTTLKVTFYNAPKKVTIKPSSYTMTVGDTVDFKVSFSKKQYSYTNKWTYSGDKTITAKLVSNVKVRITANKAGNVKLKVKSFNGKTATCKIKIVNKTEYLFGQTAFYNGKYYLNLTNFKMGKSNIFKPLPKKIQGRVQCFTIKGGKIYYMVAGKDNTMTEIRVCSINGENDRLLIDDAYIYRQDAGLQPKIFILNNKLYYTVMSSKEDAKLFGIHKFDLTNGIVRGVDVISVCFTDVYKGKIYGMNVDDVFSFNHKTGKLNVFSRENTKIGEEYRKYIVKSFGVDDGNLYLLVGPIYNFAYHTPDGINDRWVYKMNLSNGKTVNLGKTDLETNIIPRKGSVYSAGISNGSVNLWKSDSNLKNTSTIWSIKEKNAILSTLSGIEGNYALVNFSTFTDDDLVVKYYAIDLSSGKSELVAEKVTPFQSENTTGNNQNGKATDWKQMYIDFLDSDLGRAYRYAALVNLNDDDIPELILQADHMISGNRLCWIDNGEVVNADLGTLGAVTCSEREGLLIVDGLNHGISFMGVFNFDGQSIEQLHTGRATDTGKCDWDGIPVSCDELQVYYSEFSGYYRPEMNDYSTVISQILNY